MVDRPGAAGGFGSLETPSAKTVIAQAGHSLGFAWFQVPLHQVFCDFPATHCVFVVNEHESNSSPFAGMSDQAAFTTFMRNYQDMVYTTAVRLLGNDTQAEDISQEVFLKAYEHFDDLRESPTAGGWLKTVTTNLSLNHLQRYRKRWSFFSELVHREHDDERDAPEAEFAAPENFFADFDAADRREWVQAALEKLPENQRVPLVLYHFEEQSYEEIAGRLGVSLAKVKTDILRARQALAKHLTRSAGDRTALTS